MRFCDKVIFQLCRNRNTLKENQEKGGKPSKFKTKILKPTLIISICQICEAIVKKCLISRIESVLAAPHKIKKTLTFPIMMKPVHL